MAFTNLLKISNIFLPHNDHGKLHFSPHIFCFVFYSEDALSRIWIQYVNDLISFMSKIKQMLECVFSLTRKNLLYTYRVNTATILQSLARYFFGYSQLFQRFFFKIWKQLESSYFHTNCKMFFIDGISLKKRSFWDT